MSAIPGAVATPPGDQFSGHSGGVTVIPPPAGLFQPLDSDLTAIAALSTTSYGRALLALADAAAGRTAFGLGTASTHNTGDYDAAGAAAAAQAAAIAAAATDATTKANAAAAASQPVDSDLTAIAALTTTSFGRALLALANPADATKFLNGTGAFTVPAGSGSVSTGVFNVKDPTYGAVGDGTTNDTTAIQAAITAAWNAPGGTVYFPVGVYKITAALTFPTSSGEIHIQGSGRARSFSGNIDGDPTAAQGAVIRQTSTTADIMTFAPANTKRQLVTIERIALEGNPAGTTGHGIHFLAPSGAAILPTLRDVTVIDVKQHGIFYDGAVFESQWFGVRVDSCGSAGFKAAVNTAGLPGETRLFGCVFNLCDVGIDLSGGGNFSLFGVTASYCTNEGVKANGVGFGAWDLQLEANGAGVGAGNKATFTSLQRGVIQRVVSGCGSGQTGIGLAFVSCRNVYVTDYYASSAVSGAGYRDFSFSGSSRCVMNGYANTDDVDRYDLGISGTGGGANVVTHGGQYKSSQSHNQIEYSSAIDGADDLDLISADSFVSKRTVAAKTRDIRFPTKWNDAYRNGQRVTIHVYNASAGATTTTWNGFWHLAGAWVDPAAGKTRTITFEYNGYGFYEIARSTADIT